MHETYDHLKMLQDQQDTIIKRQISIQSLSILTICSLLDNVWIYNKKWITYESSKVKLNNAIYRWLISWYFKRGKNLYSDTKLSY